MYALLARGLPAIEGVLARNPGLVERIAAKIGSVASPSAILQAARNNPLTAGLLFWEAGDAGKEFYDQLVAEKPELQEPLARLTFKADDISNGFVPDLIKYKDEMELIDDASRSVGGFEALVRLKQALSLDERFLQMHAALRVMGRRG